MFFKTLNNNKRTKTKSLKNIYFFHNKMKLLKKIPTKKTKQKQLKKQQQKTSKQNFHLKNKTFTHLNN